MRSRFIMASFQLIDIGANLTDSMYKGLYNGRKYHEEDLNDVLSRAKENGVNRSIITVGHLEDVNPALDLCKSTTNLFCTVGCHPTRCNEFQENPDDYYKQLLDIALNNRDKVVAIGECGLDYDREHFCSRETQKLFFEKQFDLAIETNLPMFFHMRNASQDFTDILKKYRDKIVGGVAHCFTGSVEEARALTDMGLYVGITGCSLKTLDNIETVKTIPTEFLLVETDAPWCEIKNTHAGFKFVKTKFPTKKKERWEKGYCVKSRNEPCHLIQVIEILAAVRREDPRELADNVFRNTEKLFFSKI
ncbi:deoxyribonuclease TATDN1 [Hydra vulgaris]|uniref:Deoxyribonuclease TATDN1 n=1 Tax=Hydra vulgaris TaxID=6087 RepID=A0ABM4CJC4_HYDVU